MDKKIDNYIALEYKYKNKNVIDAINYHIQFIDINKGKIITNYTTVICNTFIDFEFSRGYRDFTLWYDNVDILVKQIWYNIKTTKIKSITLINLIESGDENKIKLAINIIKNGQEEK